MEPDWSGPQTRLGCGCKLYMVLVNDGLEAPEIDFCEIHASALGLVKKLEAAERMAAVLRQLLGRGQSTGTLLEVLAAWDSAGEKGEE